MPIVFYEYKANVNADQSSVDVLDLLEACLYGYYQFLRQEKIIIYLTDTNIWHYFSLLKIDRKIKVNWSYTIKGGTLEQHLRFVIDILKDRLELWFYFTLTFSDLLYFLNNKQSSFMKGFIFLLLEFIGSSPFDDTPQTWYIGVIKRSLSPPTSFNFVPTTVKMLGPGVIYLFNPYHPAHHLSQNNCMTSLQITYLFTFQISTTSYWNQSSWILNQSTKFNPYHPTHHLSQYNCMTSLQVMYRTCSLQISSTTSYWNPNLKPIGKVP